MNTEDCKKPWLRIRKRGGVRVIYFRRVQPALIWMLTIYAKNEAEAISLTVLRKVRQEIEND